ncbi:TonB-dependent receptor [Sphingomonas sp. FW199]|uniref:TonB-dependent receptor n=1 Tax=Sphingomonas sp. FW199 TaxID=3400217 RepID=UPI003CF70602
MKTQILRLMLGAAIGALALPHAALAQEAPTGSAPQPGEPEPDEQDAPRTAPVIEGDDVIIVSADRRAEPLQDYAGTAAVLTGDELNRIGINTLENLNDVLPGLRVQNLNGAINVALRGIGTNQNTELGDPNVATHFDDVYVPRVQGLSNAFFDLQAVEVNFGPQGTLRGRNASSGSLNFIAFKPELGNFGGMIEGGVGNYDQVSVRTVLNLPIGEKMATRISASFDSHGPYYRNVGRFPDVEAPYQADNRGVRGQWLYKPTDEISILLAGDYNYQTTTGFNGSNYSAFLGLEDGLTRLADEVEDPRAVLTGPLGERYTTEHSGFRTRLAYEPGGLFNVEYIGSYRDLRFNSKGAGPIGVAFPDFEEAFYGGAIGEERLDNYGQGISRNGSRSSFHELRLFSDDEPFKYSLGGNYFWERQRTFSSSVSDNNSFFQGQEFNTRTTSEAFAFYGDATYSVTDAFRVTGGVRYTKDRKSRTGVISRYFFGGGASDFGCCGFFRLGTPGFEFNTDRTIFDPDQNGDGIISSGEQLFFFLDGVKRFGTRDTILDAFGPAIDAINANPVLLSDPAYTIPAGRGCYTPAVAPGFQCVNGDGFTYNFVAHTINNQAAAITSDFVDWRLRAEYDITPENLVYALVSRGHKAASFNDNLGPLGPAPFFRPENVTLFEVGTKNEFKVFGRTAVFNLAAFYNNYNDQQLTALLGVQSIIEQITGPNGELIDVTGPTQVPDGFTQNQVVSFTYNAADSETYGLQGSGSIILPGNFKFGADFLWLEARVKNAEPVQDFRFQSDVNSVDAIARPINGKRLPYTPRWQFNAALAQVIPIGGGTEDATFDWLVSVSWRSSSFGTIFNSEDYRFPDTPRAFLEDRIPSYAIVNLAAGVTRGKFRVEGYVNNLTNKTVAAGLLVSQFSNTRWFTNPRLVGGRVRISF